MTKPKPNRQQIIYTRICVQCGQSFRPGKNGSEWNAIYYCNFCLDDPRSTLATKKAPPAVWGGLQLRLVTALRQTSP